MRFRLPSYCGTLIVAFQKGKLDTNRSLKILFIFVLPYFAAESAYMIWWYNSGGTRTAHTLTGKCHCEQYCCLRARAMLVVLQNGGLFSSLCFVPSDMLSSNSPYARFCFGFPSSF